MLQEIKRDVMRSGERRRQTVSVRMQGIQRYFDLLVEPNLSPGGNIDGVRCASMDITERKAAELAVIDRETRMATLADAMPQLVWIGGSDGELEYVNQRLCEYVGVYGTEAKSHDVWRKTIHPDDREQSMAVWSQAISNGEAYTLEQR